MSETYLAEVVKTLIVRVSDQSEKIPQVSSVLSKGDIVEAKVNGDITKIYIPKARFGWIIIDPEYITEHRNFEL